MSPLRGGQPEGVQPSEGGSVRLELAAVRFARYEDTRCPFSS